MPAGLILWLSVPILVGALRLLELAGAPSPMPAEPRFGNAPVLLLLHIVGATTFCLLGAVQFSPGLRERRPHLHRALGRWALPMGAVAALSGMAMAVVYEPAKDDGPLLDAVRLFFGSVMVASLALGLRALLRRDYQRHGAWMTRAYALGAAAGTQAWLVVPTLPFVKWDGLRYALVMAAGWMLNALFAEWVIRRRQQRTSVGTPPFAPASPTAAHSASSSARSSHHTPALGPW